jgi:hypothetical protein
MTMPEAAVHKYRFSLRPEYKIGLAREIFAMQPEAVAHLMDKRTDEKLGLHSLAPYPAHVL